jgi:hypothetical protein
VDSQTKKATESWKVALRTAKTSAKKVALIQQQLVARGFPEADQKEFFIRNKKKGVWLAFGDNDMA